MCLGFKIKQASQLHFDFFNIVLELGVAQKLPLGAFATRVPDGSSSTSCHSNGMMPHILKSSQGDQGNKMPHVQAVGCGIKAAIKRDRTLRKTLFQCFGIRAVGHEAAPLEFLENIHKDKIFSLIQAALTSSKAQRKRSAPEGRTLKT